MRAALAVVLCACSLSGCDLLFPPDGPDDLDRDGVPEGEDCDDTDSATYPGAGELCDGRDNDCDGVVDEGYDEDADGYNTCGADRDCDDLDPTVYPSALEECDGVDNNCDGVTDEGCAPVDADGDGYATPEDCDDTTILVHPGAQEYCNAIDDDCDGTIDEGFDQDADGWPDGSDGGCAASYDEVDCDDHDPARNPGAAEECDNEDDDCDGGIDEDFDLDGDSWTTCKVQPDCDDSDPLVYPYAPEQCNDQDDDCDGVIDEDTTDDGDGDGVTACEGDCDDGDPDVFPGAVELPNGVDDDCSGAADDGYGGAMGAGLFQPALGGDSTQARQGDQLSSGGAFNLDPYGDFVAGSGTYGGGIGRATVVLGQSFSTASPPSAMTVFATVTGGAGEYLGSSVDLGDVNGDGYDDVIVGAPELNTSTPPNGNVYVWFGGPAVGGGAWPTASADVVITGGFSTEQCGTAVAVVGDVDGDGLGELAVGCPWYDPGTGSLRGRTVVFDGRVIWPSSLTSDDAEAEIVGSTGDVESGSVLAGGFDFNGDTYADLAVGVPLSQIDEGRVGVFFGGPGGLAASTEVANANRLYTGAAGDGLGSFVVAAEATGDGYDDLLLGAPGRSSGTGALWVVFGGSNPPADGAASLVADFGVVGVTTTEQAGWAAGVVDLDADGAPDLLAPTPGWDGSGGGDQGSLQIFYGPLTSYSGTVTATAYDAQIRGSAGGDFFGGAIGVVPDFNGDGSDDVIVAAPYHDTGGGNAGRIYFVPGF